MNILVCIAPMPGRELNPFDGYALEAAARLRDRDETIRITALSLSGGTRLDTLRLALAVAADEACLVSDSLADSSDAMGRSYLLSQCVAALGPFDLVFCGRQSPEEELGQTGPLLAGWLGWVQATNALETELLGSCLKIKLECDRGEETVEADLPCVVSFTKPLWDPRLPTVRRSSAATRAEIPVLTAADLPGVNRTLCGTAGTRLALRERRDAPCKAGGVRIREKTDAESARTLFTHLSCTGVI